MFKNHKGESLAEIMRNGSLITNEMVNRLWQTQKRRGRIQLRGRIQAWQTGLGVLGGGSEMSWVKV